MEAQNQQIYSQFQNTVRDMKAKKEVIQKEIDMVNEQLVSMQQELDNLTEAIVRHEGGMATIEVLTGANMALVMNDSDQPLSLNPNQAPPTQQPTPIATPQQYQQTAPPPNQGYYSAPSPITPQAQQTFAPPVTSPLPME